LLEGIAGIDPEAISLPKSTRARLRGVQSLASTI
jgi:hypothetical protein